MRLRKDYTTIKCNGCNDDISVWKYDLTRKDSHSGFCRKCGNIKAALSRTDADRDAVFLKKQLRNIKARCSSKYDVYKSYTRKGIRVCDEWNSPEAFVLWARANGWKSGLTIDRIDNDGNYEPSNCRWITNKQNVLEKEVSRKPRGKSKYIGIWFRKDTSKWAAEIKVDKKKKSLGCYATEYEAMVVRDAYIRDNNIPYLKLNQKE